MEEKPTEKKRVEMTRRGFLKGVASGAVMNVPGADALANLADRASAQRTTQEREHEHRRGSVAIDIVPQERHEALQHILGNGDRSLELGVLDDDYESRKPGLFVNGDSETRKTIMVNEMIKDREDHGGLMQDVYGESMRQLGEPIDPTVDELLPLQEVLIFQEVMDSVENPLRNPMVDLVVDPKMLGDMLEEFFQENPHVVVVAMSFQVGRQRLEYRMRELNNLPKIPYEDPNDLDAELFLTQDNNGAVANFTRAELESLGYPIASAGVDNFILPCVVDEEGNSIPLKILTEAEYDSANVEYRRQSAQEYWQSGQSEGVREILDGQGNPSYKVIQTEAYNEKWAYGHLGQLAELARRFPGKRFVAAGGNNENYFFDARRKLEQEGLWADNIDLVGAINLSRNPNNVEADGCDIYLDATGHPQTLSSSAATQRVRALGEIINNNLPTEIVGIERRQLIGQMLRSQDYVNDGQYIGVDINGIEEARFVTRDAKILIADYWDFPSG